MQHHGHIALSGRHLIDELQQADRLGNRHRQRMVGLAGDIDDLAAVLRIDVVALQIKHPIEGHKRAHLLVSQPALGIGEQLLGQLDDRPVGTAELLAGTPGEAQTRHHLNDQLDLIRQQGVEGREAFGAQLGQANLGVELGVGGQAALVLLEQLGEGHLSLGALTQHPPAGHLSDVGGLQHRLVGEAILQTRQLGAVVVEVTHHIGELLLGGDHHPHLAPALDPELLHDRL